MKTLQRAGLEVMGGFIVGFDSDPQDIFARQFEFIQRTGVVTAMVGLLTALPETALYRRLLGEGRIVAETHGNNTDAVLNFVTRMDRDFMISGYKDLMRRLYAPRNYYRRIQAFLHCFEPRGPARRLSPSDVKAFMKSLWLLGMLQPGRRHYWLLFLVDARHVPEEIACCCRAFDPWLPLPQSRKHPLTAPVTPSSSTGTPLNSDNPSAQAQADYQTAVKACSGMSGTERASCLRDARDARNRTMGIGEAGGDSTSSSGPGGAAGNGASGG